jgi:hypothetical protein
LRRLAERLLAACILLPALAGAGERDAAPEPSAARIVEQNAAARGGAEAWRKIQTMAVAGHVEGAATSGRALPFLLEEKRPNRTRFEIMAASQKSVRVFDGRRGWKMRPDAEGRPQVQDYTAEELSFARDSQSIEGPLMDAVARGLAVTLGGVETVEGHRAFRLDFSPRPGTASHVWVDAETFLELAYERELRTSAGRMARISVRYRDYRTFEGLQIPVTIETGGGGGTAGNKLVIDRVALNPRLEDRIFARPSTPLAWRRGAVIDTRGAASANDSRPTR